MRIVFLANENEWMNPVTNPLPTISSLFIGRVEVLSAHGAFFIRFHVALNGWMWDAAESERKNVFYFVDEHKANPSFCFLMVKL